MSDGILNILKLLPKSHSHFYPSARSEGVPSLWVERLGVGALYCKCCGTERSEVARCEAIEGPYPIAVRLR